MRMPRLEVSGTARLTAWLVVIGFVISGAQLYAITNTSAPPASATAPTNQGQAPASAQMVVKFSPGIPDILRMVEARVDSQVIKSYIRNSPFAYNPSAAELIALKERGVSDDLLTALVERGAQVKAQARQAAPARPTPSSPTAPVPYAYPYQSPYPAYAGAYPGYGAYPYIAFPSPPLISFNNSYPTYINGYPVYSGYYVPGYGYFW